MTLNAKDLVAGGIFIAIGAFVCIAAFAELSIGTAQRMGPGYFPVALGIILSAFGLLIAFRAVGKESSPFGKVSWRGVVLISVAPIAFALTVRGLGLAPAIALAALLSTIASRKVSIPKAIAVTVGLTALSILIFSFGLGLPFQLLGPWLGY